MSSPHAREYVLNPLTNRVIRKGGKVYNRWRRTHPNEPEPPVISMHPWSITPPNSPVVASQPSRSYHDDDNVAPRSRSWDRYDTHTQPHDLSGKDPARSLSPPPLRRANALGEEGFRAQYGIPFAATEPALRPPMKSPRKLQDSGVVEDLLRTRGPDLLRAYHDPNVDFMDELANAFGVHARTPSMSGSKKKESVCPRPA